MKVYLKFCLVSMLAICSFNAQVFAFEFTGARWGIAEGETVDYFVNRELSEDMADSTCLEAIKAGYEVWKTTERREDATPMQNV